MMFYQIFFSSQVKRRVIISCKHGIYELPHELVNDLRLRILGNYKISGKYLNFIKLFSTAQCLYQNNIVITRKTLLKNRN